MTRQITHNKNCVNSIFLVDEHLTAVIRIMNSNHTGKPNMSFTIKINPIAKLLRDKKYKHKTVPDKKKSKLNKLAKKEMDDGKTSKDT